VQINPTFPKAGNAGTFSLDNPAQQYIQQPPLAARIISTNPFTDDYSPSAAVQYAYNNIHDFDAVEDSVHDNAALGLVHGARSSYDHS
jgi:hypothetical protein